MDRAINVCLGVGDDFVSVLVESFVGLQRIGVEFRAGCDVLSNLAVKVLLAARAYYRCVNLARLRDPEGRTQWLCLLARDLG